MQLRDQIRYGLCVMACLLASPALPEPTDSFFERNRNSGVIERVRPDYQSDPIRLGAFGLRPTLQIDLGYDDNIYANDQIKRADFVSHFEATALLKAGWSRHKMSANAYVRHHQYAFETSESTTSFGLGGSGGANINHAIEVGGGGYIRWEHEPRTLANIDDQIELGNQITSPIAYNLLGGYMDQSAQYRRVRMVSKVKFTNINYSNALQVNGDTLSQDHRDRHGVDVKLRGDYALSPATSVFIRGAWKGIYFVENPATSQSQNSNSHDAKVEIGVDLDIGNAVRGQLSVGYISRFFTRTGFEALQGVGFEAGLRWFVTPYITTWLEGQRDYAISGLYRSPASLNSRISLGMDYEFRPNIIGSGQFDYSHSNFERIDRVDELISGKISLHWLLNRYLTLGMNYAPSTQASIGVDANRQYTAHTVFLVLKAQH